MCIACVAHGVKHWLNRIACYLELPKRLIHIWTRHTYSTHTHPRARTPPHTSQFRLYFHFYAQTGFMQVRFVCEWMWVMRDMDQMLSPIPPVNFSFKSQWRNSQLALPKLANHVRETHTLTALPSPNPLCLPVYLYNTPSSPRLFLSLFWVSLSGRHISSQSISSCRSEGEWGREREKENQKKKKMEGLFETRWWHDSWGGEIDLSSETKKKEQERPAKQIC